MTYLVTARKWRPMVFEEVVGQSHVATTLRNAIATNRLSHAYIFSGPRGVGKTTMARILAKAINCRHPRDFNPDNECDTCMEITEGRGIDVLEIDGASNRGVDEIRNLKESVRYAPAKGKYKVYIIDEVHMLTKEAFNALLKTLEEPPSQVLFIFATTEVHKVPPTILSRCQRFDFRRITVEEIVQRLRHIADQEHITIDNDALLIIAKKADGSLRDGQSIFDQVISFCGDRITAQQIMEALNVVDEELYFRTTELIHAKDTKGGFALVDDVITRGYDIKEFLSGLNEHFRNILIALATHSTKLIEASEIFKKRYETEAQRFSDQDIFRLMKFTSDVIASLRWTDQPRFRLEVGILQMIRMDHSIEIEQLLRQIEELKKTTGDSTGPRADLRVTGSVKASPPTRTAAAARFPRETAPSETTPVRQWVGSLAVPVLHSLELVHAPGPGEHGRSGDPAIAEPIRVPADQWLAFVEAASRERVMVGTVLRESEHVAMNDGTLRVGCADDVSLSMLKRNREYLTDVARQIYGARTRLEAVLSSKAIDPTPVREHPVISALKRELGAEPIE